MQENEELTEGVYRIKYDTMTTTCEDIVEGDQIRVINGAHIDEVLGLKIYEGTHIKTNHESVIQHSRDNQMNEEVKNNKSYAI